MHKDAKEEILCNEDADRKQVEFLAELGDERSYRTLCLLIVDHVRELMMKGAQQSFREGALEESAERIAVKLDLEDAEQWLRGLPKELCSHMQRTKSTVLKDNSSLLAELVSKYEDGAQARKA